MLYNMACFWRLAAGCRNLHLGACVIPPLSLLHSCLGSPLHPSGLLNCFWPMDHHILGVLVSFAVRQGAIGSVVIYDLALGCLLSLAHVTEPSLVSASRNHDTHPPIVRLLLPAALSESMYPSPGLPEWRSRFIAANVFPESKMFLAITLKPGAHQKSPRLDLLKPNAIGGGLVGWWDLLSPVAWPHEPRQPRVEYHPLFCIYGTITGSPYRAAALTFLCLSKERPGIRHVVAPEPTPAAVYVYTVQEPARRARDP